MRIVISLTSACLFVFLAGFNLWSMLTGQGTSARSARFWTQAHRVAGYLFIALFAIFTYFMFLRVKGWQDEFSPRLLLHISLALSLAPLLLVKVLVARYQKASRALLSVLGISIFTAAFTLVALNVAAHFLRVAAPGKVPRGESAVFVVVVLIMAAIALFGRGLRSESMSSGKTLSLDTGPAQNASTQRESLTLTLARVEPQTHDAKTLRFLLPPNATLAARPGQFLTFQWTIDGKLVPRSYSISSSPTQAGYIDITPKRVANGRVSQFLNDHAHPGLTVKAQGPYGRFCFDPARDKRIVLIAGGSGITPMMAILHYIDDLCIPVDSTLVYCVRTERDLIFRTDLEALQARSRNFRYVPVLSQPGSDWTGWKGRLRSEILDREIQRTMESTFFLCGPSAFMEHSHALLRDMAVDPSRILRESFGSAVSTDKTSVLQPGLLKLDFARSSVACTISPDKTVLESSENNGVLIPSGCRQGSCGTCATRLLKGNVHMEYAEALNDDLRAQGYILPCVSRPLSDITLDA